MLVLSAALGLVCYFAIYAVVGLIAAYIVGSIIAIPWLAGVLAVIFKIPLISADLFVCSFAAMAAFPVASALIEKLCYMRCGTAKKIVGVVLVIFAVVNILLGGDIAPNIVNAVSGISFFFNND